MACSSGNPKPSHLASLSCHLPIQRRISNVKSSEFLR
ncbi:hypothetical protein OESDEN_25668 [Oesophagostomum dentatum]|uniref:Uncharacterized protein n=1 Tax=Oesophagostomum dentatum TaxID=61180 RepID=A0A0B1RSU4_OESDE|nr:hypothetical protein OESDEN_25668 [Oesophagostomum dentatum]